MRKREKWELILLALYAEAIHCGSFAEVTAGTMDMTSGEFGWMLYQLQNKVENPIRFSSRCATADGRIEDSSAAPGGMIEGCKFQPPNPCAPGCLMGVLRDGLMLTPLGFQTAEAWLGTTSLSACLRALWEILRDAGCGVMASVIYQWIQ